MGATRARRTAIIVSRIDEFFGKEPKGRINRQKFIANFCLDTDASKRTAVEILMILEMAKRIKQSREEIWI